MRPLPQELPPRGLRGPVVAILNVGSDDRRLIERTEALIRGGIRTVEVTLRAETSLGTLARLSDEFGDDIQLGAGTILTTEQAHAAIDAGASFLVSPGVSQDVMRSSQAREVLVIPGVFTPTEIMDALSSGAEMVKLFPAGALGPRYLRDLRGPFPDLRVMSTGRISVESVPEYFAAGAKAVGLGRELVGNDSEPLEPRAIETRVQRIMELIDT